MVLHSYRSQTEGLSLPVDRNNKKKKHRANYYIIIITITAVLMYRYLHYNYCDGRGNV